MSVCMALTMCVYSMVQVGLNFELSFLSHFEAAVIKAFTHPLG